MPTPSRQTFAHGGFQKKPTSLLRVRVSAYPGSVAHKGLNKKVDGLPSASRLIRFRKVFIEHSSNQTIIVTCAYSRSRIVKPFQKHAIPTSILKNL